MCALVTGVQTCALPIFYPQDTRMLLALMGRPRLSMDEAAEILWPAAAFMPDEWHKRVHTLMSRLRAKIRPLGWTIEARYNFGWRLARHGTADDRGAEETRAAA